MATGLSKTKWNGKNLHPISENIFDIHLTYPGKRSEEDILATQPTSTSLLWRGNEGNKKTITNRLYYGDNLPILASLLEDSSICGKVRLIYIDPPFATNSVFQSRSQDDAYADTLVGASYIEFLRERLVLLRELLAHDGSIYVHLDQKMAFHIKIIMDEIFGRNNFQSWITRKKCNPKNYTRKSYGNISDYILFYTKSSSYVWNRPHEQWSIERAEKEYPYVEQETGRRYKKVPIHAPGTRNGETGKPWRGKLPPPGKHWQFPPQTLDEMDARGEIYWSPNGNPRRKIYLDESEGVAVQDIWVDFRDAHNQNIEITGYPTEKNPGLLARIIAASSNPGDFVLDCFSGSGTTLAVASQLNRQWIGIDNSVEAITTTLRRFAKGTEPMGDFVSKPSFLAENGTTRGPAELSLWEQLEQEQTEQNNAIMQKERKVIRDFSLYAVDAVREDLCDVLKQWLEWI
ncbi:MAG TPA: site-specific DNA-methyltransferase [Ktedonobacteraceae bacterium]|nr:site-specific DNA-methyltransferase [Ktedonobacteraceae bacterium]